MFVAPQNGLNRRIRVKCRNQQSDEALKNGEDVFLPNFAAVVQSVGGIEGCCALCITLRDEPEMVSDKRFVLFRIQVMNTMKCVLVNCFAGPGWWRAAQHKVYLICYELLRYGSDSGQGGR
jgi:hypothetical protein